MLVFVVSDFLWMSFVSCMRIKGKMLKNITVHIRTRPSLWSPLCVWMLAVTLHSRDIQQRPSDLSKSAVRALSFCQCSHDLHLMTLAFYSHHLLCFYFLPDLCLSHLSVSYTPTFHPSQFDFLLHHLIFLPLLSLSELQNWLEIWNMKRHISTLLIQLKKQTNVRTTHTEGQSTVQLMHRLKIQSRVWNKAAGLGRLQVWQVQINTALSAQAQETCHSFAMQLKKLV